MVRLVKGFAGCGKTNKLLEDVYSLLDKEEVNSNNILVLALSNGEKNELISLNQAKPNYKNITIWSIDNLFNYLLKKSPSTNDLKTISDFLAIQLIGSICRKEFKQNSALDNLTKSNTFFRELYNLFGLFKNNEITYEKLNQSLLVADISVQDKARLGLVFSVFDKYNQLLKNCHYLDYRDVVIQSMNALESNKFLLGTIKSKFQYVFIDGIEDITYLQFNLIKMIADSDNLYLYGDEYSRVQEFRGAWKDSLIVSALKSNFKDVELIELEGSKRNAEILERAIYLVKKYNSEKAVANFRSSDCIKYKLYEDIQGEIGDIAKDILNKVQSGTCNFSDCAVLIRDYDAKQKLIDLFKSQGIPVNSELYNQEYQNFKFALTRYLSICGVLEKLSIKTFDKAGISSVSIKSRAEKEILFEELNLYIENLLAEILDDFYVKERFVSIQEESKNVSLLDVVYKNINLLKDSDKKNLKEEFSRISDIYEMFKAQDFVALLLYVSKNRSDAFKNDLFNSIFARLLSKVKAVSDLYKNVLEEKLDSNIIVDIVSSSVEERLNVSDSVNLLTFFATVGLEFKHVYIPSLTEKVFPKMVKSTYFVSQISNESISKEIQKNSSNFRHLIELDKDSIEEEARLFYLGMTRAKDSLTISTHRWEDKKQIQPSVFYQMLVSVDKNNYQEVFASNDDAKEFVISENGEVDQLQDLVIDKSQKLRLNTSSISNFLTCPKKYFCKNLLNLKEESLFAASYGSIVHAILEVFVKNNLDKYSKETVLSLGEILFNAKFNPLEAISNGFKQMDIDKVIATDDLSLAEMKENFGEAIEQLDLNAFFEKVPVEVLTEKSFKFSIEELENIEFDGRIDAICKFDDGYKIIDYKTGKNKEPDLDKMLNFKTQSNREPQNMDTYLQKFEYQIPLYYLASQNAEELKDFKNKISQLGLLYVRPKSKHDGYKDDFVSGVIIEEQKEKLIENLKTTVIDKILEKTYFEPNKNYMICENCSYNFLCDESEDNDADN